MAAMPPRIGVGSVEQEPGVAVGTRMDYFARPNLVIDRHRDRAR